MQMHIHGHSHHNGDRRAGSMQWHSHFAAAHDLSVLWWTDHSDMFDLSSPLEISYGPERSPRPPTRQELRQAGLEAVAGISVGLIKAPAGEVEWIEARDREASGRKLLVARSRPQDREFTESLYAIRGPKGPLKGFLLPRPVSSGALLTIDMQAGELTPDARINIEVGLSWHHRGAPRRHLLRYRLAPEWAAQGRRVEKKTTAVFTVPVPRGRTRMSFDLEEDAEHLIDGTDNTITSVQIRLGSRRGAEAALEIYGVELSSSDPEPDHQLKQIREFASAYAAEYGHAQHVGVEFFTEDDEYIHINAFLPAGALTGDLASGDETTWGDPAEFVRRVRQLGGVTSFNHLFGTTTGLGRRKQEERRSRARALDLLDNGAHGVDLLEVGYTRRGGVGLEYHLRTWDRLTARGLYLYGNGVSDSHGSEWGPRMKPNHFATWIWSEGPGADQLIEAIRRGRMVFGDPFVDVGRFYFRVGDAEMGDRVAVRKEPQELRVAVEEWFEPANHRLYLVQARIRPQRERVLYMTGITQADYRREIVADEPLTVDVSRPCFLRLELYDIEGRPLRFTNPIVFDRKE
ncbi:MAG: hypothetical protein GY769_06325 [bacterium]|nr:hypothetical protein [bacterium]